MFYLNIRYNPITPSQETQKIIVRPSIPPQTISSRHDIFNDPYAPPLKSDGLYFRNDSSDIRGVPPIHPPIQVLFIETRGLSTNTSKGFSLHPVSPFLMTQTYEREIMQYYHFQH